MSEKSSIVTAKAMRKLIDEVEFYRQKCNDLES